MKKRLFMFSVMLLSIMQVALAQVTTAALTGKVTLDNTNEEVIGATIQAVHEPSGTRYGAVTNANGRYTIQGMRVGGPYKVTVSYIGYKNRQGRRIKLNFPSTAYLSSPHSIPLSVVLD